MQRRGAQGPGHFTHLLSKPLLWLIDPLISQTASLLSGQSWHACTDRYVSAITSNVCLPRQANRGLGKCLERELSRLRDSEITGKCQPPNSLNLREKGTDSPDQNT